MSKLHKTAAAEEAASQSDINDVGAAAVLAALWENIISHEAAKRRSPYGSLIMGALLSKSMYTWHNRVIMPVGHFHGDTAEEHFERALVTNIQLDDRVMRLLSSIHGKTNLSAPSLSEKDSLQAAPLGQEYVDPYLFETGHFESREEYEELTRTAQIKPRKRA